MKLQRVEHLTQGREPLGRGEFSDKEGCGHASVTEEDKFS